MGLLDKIFGSSNQSNGGDHESPDYFEFKYEYENESYGDEGMKSYRINVTVEFTWDETKGEYEVNSYARSPDGFTDVEIPNYSEFENDVNGDLHNKGINPIYIPDMDEWNFY
ncbi:hypothetical protein [Pontibacillus salipaludis]|uniref:hypothetical protein n=1 Tax=Pontibacillus salipaludis TaxID=1697394 RepID=UPI0031E98EC2